MASVAPLPDPPPSSSPRVEVKSIPGIIQGYMVGTYNRYRKAPPLAKVFVWFFLVFNICVVTLLFVVGPSVIAQTLYNLSQELRKLRFGWLLLASIIAVTSFPPLIGWSTSISVCGFAYGLQGWFVAALGAMVGAAVSFLTLRVLFKKRIRSWSETNRKWQALENVIRARGLPLIILIRLSPFPPWVYANLLFASIETVSFIQFMIATLVYTPKLMIAVWIGSRVAMLSDGSQREKMDTKGKIVNALSIVIGVGLAVGTGWLVWRLTEKEIKRTSGVDPEDDQLASQALEDAVEDMEAPLIRSLSPERYRDEPLENAYHPRRTSSESPRKTAPRGRSAV